MEPLSVYLTVDDRVDVVHCHKGWTLEQVLAAHGGFHALDVVYTDNRGVEIPIGSEADYREALQFCEQEAGTWRISLELSHVEGAPDASDQPAWDPSLATQPRVGAHPVVEPEPARPDIVVAPEGGSAAASEPDLIVQATVNGGATIDIRASQDGASFAQIFDRWENPRVTYVDEEGDLITVGSEMEWCEALRCAAQDGVMRVNVALPGPPAGVPAPALDVAVVGQSGSHMLVIRVLEGTASERMIRTTTDAPFEEVTALVGTAVLEYVDDDGDTITCSSALEWPEAVRFATRNSHGELQLDVTVGMSLAGAEDVPSADLPVAVRLEQRERPMPDDVLGEALHGWLLARAASSEGTPPPPSPLTCALKLAESQQWDDAALRLTLDGSAAATVARGPELWVTESCWGTISFLPPPTEASRRAKITGSAILQVAHGTMILRQVDLRGLTASKVRASRGKDGDVVRCTASSSGGTLSVKISEDGVRLDRGEELLIQYAV